MYRLRIIALLLGLLVMSFLAWQLALACDINAYCHMNYDTSPSDTDGPYDPCDDNVSWSCHFYRTDKDNSTQTEIQWDIRLQSGSLAIHREYLSSNFGFEQWYTPTGTNYVGSSSWHKLELHKYSGPGGHFNDISITVNYVAGDPGRPEGP